MKSIQAIWKDGRIIPTQSVDWPEGTALTVEPVGDSRDSQDDLLGNDPESIARWIAAYDNLPPLKMSEAEESEWIASRREVKEHTSAKMRALSIEDRP